MKELIYLDHHSTTPCDARVVERMLPYFSEKFGNPGSAHAFGWVAEEACEVARARVAKAIGATAREIVFVSGATEAIALALQGCFEANKDKGTHMISQPTEHKAVLESLCDLKKRGAEVTFVEVDSRGRVSPDAVESAIRDETLMVAIMAANNEIGTLQPIKEIGEICKRRNVFFFVDAAQAVGKIPVDVQDMNIDMLALSGHKLYGPKGIGALYVRRRDPRVNLAPCICGGGQERGLRSGTLNVPGIVGLGEACVIAVSEMEEEGKRCAQLRDLLQEKLLAGISDLRINGSEHHRLPANLNISIPGVDSSALNAKISRQIAISGGSACGSKTMAPSYVLTAIGVKPEIAQNTIRFGLGRKTTREEVLEAAECVIEAVSALRRV
jgi:cysteine desulfurase